MTGCAQEAQPSTPLGYWILNGPGHRDAELSAMVVAMAETELALGGDVDQVVADAGEEWVCDHCNGTVPVFHPLTASTGPDPTRLPPVGRLRPIPVYRGQVLCPGCFRRALGDIRRSATWPGCGCPPCAAADGRTPHTAA